MSVSQSGKNEQWFWGKRANEKNKSKLNYCGGEVFTVERITKSN